MMTPLDREQKVVNLILDCITDEEDDDRRYTGIFLIDTLAETLGEDLCRDYILYEFVSMQDDPIFKIRREMVMRLPKISRVLGEQIFVGVVIPVYRKLS